MRSSVGGTLTGNEPPTRGPKVKSTLGVAARPYPVFGVLTTISTTYSNSDGRSFSRNAVNVLSSSLCRTIACVKPISIASGEEQKRQLTQKFNY